MAERMPEAVGALGENQPGEVGARRDPGMGAGHAAPVVFADGTRGFAGGRRILDRKARAEHRVRHLPGGQAHLHARRELVGVHQRDRLLRQVAFAVPLAAVDDHLDEAGVVADGAHQTAAAGMKALGREHAADQQIGAGLESRLHVVAQIEGHVVLGQPVMFFRRHMKIRIHHAQRFEQALAQKIAKALPGPDLDQPPQDVDADAVIPARAGLKDQRQRGELVDHLLQRRIHVHDALLGVEPVHRRLGKQPVGEARAVADQLAQRRRCLQRLGVCHFGRTRLHHPQVAKLGDVIGHCIVQIEHTLVVEHHHRRRGDDLGAGIDAEDGVFLHRRFGFEIGLPPGFDIDDRAALEDHGHQPADQPAIDIGLHGGVDGTEVVAGRSDGQAADGGFSRCWPPAPRGRAIAQSYPRVGKHVQRRTRDDRPLGSPDRRP